MVTIITADDRTLSFEPTEEVLIIGTWEGTTMTERRRCVLDVRPGNWLHLPSAKALGDRDYDFVLVRNIAGKPEPWAPWSPGKECGALPPR